MNNLRRFSGLKAKRQGEEFENRFFHQASISGFECIRIPDGCRTFRNARGQLSVVKVKSPFDFILLSENKSIFIDTKSTSNKYFTRSEINFNQVSCLLRAAKYHMAGYVVWFKLTDEIVFFHAEKLNNLRRGSSLSQTMGISLGTLMKFDLSKIEKLSLSNASSL